VKARRPCLGYPDLTDLHFVPYHKNTNENSCFKNVLAISKQPNQALLSYSGWFPGATIDAEVESQALEAFLHDYCFAAEDRLLSRGYLDGLETLLAFVGPSSELARATSIVALANLGTKSGSPALLCKARIMYSEMLHSLQLMISDESIPSTAELLMTAVLLGLYEVCICCDRDSILLNSTTLIYFADNHSYGRPPFQSWISFLWCVCSSVYQKKSA
jgi:hypothetical protein